MRPLPSNAAPVSRLLRQARRRAHGFSLLDVILFVSVLGLLAGGYLQALSGVAARTAQAHQQQLALALAQGTVTQAMALPFAQWRALDGLSWPGPGCAGLCDLQGRPWPAATALAGCRLHAQLTPHALRDLPAQDAGGHLQALHLHVVVQCPGLGAVSSDGYRVRDTLAPDLAPSHAPSQATPRMSSQMEPQAPTRNGAQLSTHASAARDAPRGTP